MQILYNHPILKERRQALRKDQTPAEHRLWMDVRNRRLQGIKFFRQYSVGPYILDFYSPEIRLCIELDGGYHEERGQKVYDQDRNAFLESMNIVVLRFCNEEVFHARENILHRIRIIILHLKQSPS